MTPDMTNRERLEKLIKDKDEFHKAFDVIKLQMDKLMDACPNPVLASACGNDIFFSLGLMTGAYHSAHGELRKHLEALVELDDMG